MSEELEETALAEIVRREPTTGMSIRGTSTEALAQKEALAIALAGSNLVPAAWRGKTADVMLLLDTADRMGVSPAFLFQNSYPVSGRLGWFTNAAAAVASSSRVWLVEPDWRTGRDPVGNLLFVDCAAVTRDGRPVYSRITMEEVISYGWDNKKSGPWAANPEHMMRWRSMARLIKLYAPIVASFAAPLEDMPEDQVADMLSRGVTLFSEPPGGDTRPISEYVDIGNGQRTLITYLPPDTQALVAARSPMYIVLDAQIRQMCAGWSLWKIDDRLRKLKLMPLSERPLAKYAEFMQAFSQGNYPPGFVEAGFK